MADDTFTFRRLEEELERKVARLRSEGFSREEVAGMTAEERAKAGRARGDAFSAVTQGRGKPSTYGHGKPPEGKKE